MSAQPTADAVTPQPLERPIFVVGNPRSGTTLLASMLGRHPQVCSTPETLYLSEVQFQVRPWLPRGPQAVAERLNRSRAKHLQLPTDTLAAALAQLPRLSTEGVFATLLALYRQRQGKPRVLEKSPPHLRHIAELLQAFPDAQVLWIVRDARACIASLRKVDWASDDELALARQWRRNMRFGLAAVPAAGDRLMRLSYERLVADPAGVMGTVLPYLGLPEDASVFDHRIEAGTIAHFEQAWKQHVNNPVDTARRDAWRGELSPEVLNRTAPVINPLLRELGYPTEPLPSVARWSGHWERLREHLLLNPVSVGGLRWAQGHRRVLEERWRMAR